MSKTLAIGIAVGVGIAAISGGIAYAVSKNKSNLTEVEKAALARLSRVQRPLPYAVPVQVPVVGRPFSDPFHSGATVWGSGLWAHRTPRMRPVHR